MISQTHAGYGVHMTCMPVWILRSSSSVHDGTGTGISSLVSILATHFARGLPSLESQ